MFDHNYLCWLVMCSQSYALARHLVFVRLLYLVHYLFPFFHLILFRQAFCFPVPPVCPLALVLYKRLNLGLSSSVGLCWRVSSFRLHLSVMSLSSPFLGP